MPFCVLKIRLKIKIRNFLILSLHPFGIEIIDHGVQSALTLLKKNLKEGWGAYGLGAFLTYTDWRFTVILHVNTFYFDRFIQNVYPSLIYSHKRVVGLSIAYICFSVFYVTANGLFIQIITCSSLVTLKGFSDHEIFPL